MYDKYILNSDSPIYLRSSYEFALASIKRDVNSANYINWSKMNEQEYKNLIQELIKRNYVLSSDSCSALQNDIDIVWHSIRQNIYTIVYADLSIQNNPEIIKYLIQKKYDYKEAELRKLPISVLNDPIIMEYILNKLSFLNREDDNNKGKIINLFTESLNTLPKIENYKSRLQYITEALWNDNREDNLNDFANIFGKICTELNSNEDFDDACSNLLFLPKMSDVLEHKYQLLINAMKDYHSLYHNGCKFEELASFRNDISNLAALYISISKEKYKKNIVADFNEDLKLYFIPRKDNYYIQKKIKEYKQQHEYRRLFKEGNSEINDFLENIVDGWSKIVDKNIIRMMIEAFLVKNCSKLNHFIKAPSGFNNYKRYTETKKLINRLNSKYLKYTDSEVLRYVDIIKYDSENDKYYYGGPSFTPDAINKYNEYIKMQEVFEKLKQQIVLNAKKLEVNEEITHQELVAIREDVPFTDEYFEFDKSIFSEINVGDFLETFFDDMRFDGEISNEDFSFIKKHFINNNLLWLMLITVVYESDVTDYNDLCKESLFEMIANAYEIIRLAGLFSYDLNDYENVMKLCELSRCADDEAIAILGKDVILRLCESREYTSDYAEGIISSAKELVCKMATRNKSTVPYINGELGNYKYSMYDAQDAEILLSGINTKACFRIDGNDNDFLFYCALDKNGFVIKIVDEFGNFIARASGFRNGNGVYINQLRTIYDFGGLGYEGDCLSEKEKIIETFKKACQDIVDISQNNKYEHDKIDFVLVTKSYALDDLESNVSKETERKIGNTPMDYRSEDWFDFVNNTYSLQEIIDARDFFSTDYGDYSLICIAHSKRIGDSKEMKLPIKAKNVEALYTRKRSKIIIDNPSTEILEKVNKIRGIYSFLNADDFESVVFPMDAIVFLGDNWFIVYNKGEIIDECILDTDKNACIEYDAAKMILESNIMVDYSPDKKLFLAKRSNF